MTATDTTTSLEVAVEEAFDIPCNATTGSCDLPATWYGMSLNCSCQEPIPSCTPHKVGFEEWTDGHLLVCNRCAALTEIRWEPAR